MSIQIAREIHCDGCGEWLRVEASAIRYVWPSLKREGWTRGGGKHYCPECAEWGKQVRIRRFRSIVSGLWHEDPKAAGRIDAVEVGGKVLIRKDGEGALPWVHRVAEWAEGIHSVNEAGVTICDNCGGEGPLDECLSCGGMFCPECICEECD